MKIDKLCDLYNRVNHDLHENKYNVNILINTEENYLSAVYDGRRVCKIKDCYNFDDTYHVEFEDGFFDESYLPSIKRCPSTGLVVYHIERRIAYYNNNKKGQKDMSKLEELRDYLYKEIGHTVTVIYDRATGAYKDRDRIRIKRNGCWVCSIYDTKSPLFNVIFYDPFICRSVGYSPVVNLTIEEVPKAIKNRINICDSTIINDDNRINVNIDISDEAIEKQIYMMTARGSGKTRWISEMFKNSFPFKDHIKDVIFNDPATIVFWVDGSKTVVKCQKGETFDPEKGLAMAISKKVLGNDYGYYETFAKYVGRYNKKHKEK